MPHMRYPTPEDDDPVLLFVPKRSKVRHALFFPALPPQFLRLRLREWRGSRRLTVSISGSVTGEAFVMTATATGRGEVGVRWIGRAPPPRPPARPQPHAS